MTPRKLSLFACACALAAHDATPLQAAGLLDTLREAGRTVAQGVETNAQAGLGGESTVIGYVEVQSPGVGYVTCFKDVPGSAFSPHPISLLQQASGYPAMIVTRSGVISGGQCSELIKHGLLIPVQSGARAMAPATAPLAAAPLATTGNDPDADGARACQLSSAGIAMLRDLALRFVRFDRARDRIVMSDIVNGSRAEVEMDDKTFAQRASQSSQDITRGGVACGRAYWDAQAIKSASDAITAAQ